MKKVICHEEMGGRFKVTLKRVEEGEGDQRRVIINGDEQLDLVDFPQISPNGQLLLHFVTKGEYWKLL